MSELEQFFEILPAVFEALAYIVAGAAGIAAITPTPRDDTLWGRVYKALELLALNVGRAKQLPPNWPKPPAAPPAAEFRGRIERRPGAGF